MSEHETDNRSFSEEYKQAKETEGEQRLAVQDFCEGLLTQSSIESRLIFEACLDKNVFATVDELFSQLKDKLEENKTYANKKSIGLNLFYSHLLFDAPLSVIYELGIDMEKLIFDFIEIKEVKPGYVSERKTDQAYQIIKGLEEALRRAIIKADGFKDKVDDDVQNQILAREWGR